VRALGEIDDPRPSVLLAALRDKAPVRSSAAWALGESRTRAPSSRR
jgi:hypothetical protein